MKSENWVLTCCVLFAFVMLAGLTTQSCRSAKQEKTVIKDSIGSLVLAKNNDSLSFERLLERYRRTFTFQREIYSSVQDSAGRVVGSVLAERQTTDLQVEHEMDSTDLRRNLKSHDEDRQTEVNHDTKITSEKGKPPIYIAILSLLILFCFVYCVRRKT